MAFKAYKSSNLTKVESTIMSLCSRIASQVPPGPSRTQLYNIEANNALMRCLPQYSANLVTNLYNTLTSRLGRLPSFCEITKILTKHHDVISEDIKQNGMSGSPINKIQQKTTFPMNKSRPFFKSYATMINQENQFNQRPRNSYPQSTPSNFGRQNYDSKYPANRNQNRANFNQSSRPNQTKYCALCAGRNHTAADICLKIRDSNGRCVRCVPTLDPCSICIKKIDKKLYHPPELCMNRDNHPGFPRVNLQKVKPFSS